MNINKSNTQSSDARFKLKESKDDFVDSYCYMILYKVSDAYNRSINNPSDKVTKLVYIKTYEKAKEVLIANDCHKKFVIMRDRFRDIVVHNAQNPDKLIMTNHAKLEFNKLYYSRYKQLIHEYEGVYTHYYELLLSHLANEKVKILNKTSNDLKQIEGENYKVPSWDPIRTAPIPPSIPVKGGKKITPKLKD
jgi:hypothetical protein